MGLTLLDPSGPSDPDAVPPSRRHAAGPVVVVAMALLLASLVALAVVRGHIRQQGGPPPSLRVEQGVVARYETARSAYAEVRAPALLGENDVLLTREDRHNRIRLPRGGRMILDAGTGLTLQQISNGGDIARMRVSLAQGRIWLDPTSREEVVVSTNSTRVAVCGASCEVRLYQDKDFFRNTVTSVFGGIVRLEAAPGLSAPRELPTGARLHTDDATTSPQEMFAPERMDPWEEWSSREH